MRKEKPRKAEACPLTLSDYVSAAKQIDDTDGGIYQKAARVLEVLRLPKPYKTCQLANALLSVPLSYFPDESPCSVEEAQKTFCESSKPGAFANSMARHSKNLRALLSRDQ